MNKKVVLEILIPIVVGGLGLWFGIRFICILILGLANFMGIHVN